MDKVKLLSTAILKRRGLAAKLAGETDLSHSTIRRIAKGEISPKYKTVEQLWGAFQRIESKAGSKEASR